MKYRVYLKNKHDDNINADIANIDADCEDEAIWEAIDRITKSTGSWVVDEVEVSGDD